MLSVLSRLWNWLPSPLGFVCATVCSWFFLLILGKLVKIIVDLVSTVIKVIKGLLISWGLFV